MSRIIRFVLAASAGALLCAPAEAANRRGPSSGAASGGRTTVARPSASTTVRAAPVVRAAPSTVRSAPVVARPTPSASTAFRAAAAPARGGNNAGNGRNGGGPPRRPPVAAAGGNGPRNPPPRLTPIFNRAASRLPPRGQLTGTFNNAARAPGRPRYDRPALNLDPPRPRF